MRIRVTKAITKYGRHYAAGEIIEAPSPMEDSLRRTYKWEILPDSNPVLGSLKKADLVEVAVERGLDVDGLTKAEILEVLEA